MILYLVIMDDYEPGWPDGIFDNKEDAIRLAEELSGKYNDFSVLEYYLNRPTDMLTTMIVHTTKKKK